MSTSNAFSLKKVYITYLVGGILIIIGLFALIITNSKLSATAKGPKIVFEEESHYFGKVPQGPQLQYNFRFKNKGNEVLKIEDIRTSCGCTGATVGDKKEYKKNEGGEISVTFNTQGRIGPQEKEIRVFSNDPENGEKILKVSCDIDPTMQF